MAAIAVTVRYADNMEQWVNNLQKGVDQIEAVKAGVDKMAETLNGNKLIAAANNAVAAIDRVGISTLTAAQAADKLELLERGMEKLQLRGMPVSTAMQTMADKLKAMTKPAEETASRFGVLEGQWLKLTSAFSAATLIDRAVTGLVSIGREALASAGHIVDLANKTGLSTTAIQQYAFVAEQTGASVESFADASFKLGLRLGEGSKDVTRALNALGLSYKDLENLSPDAQFDKVARALSGLENTTERNRVGTDLFGKSYASIAGSMGDYAELVDQVRVADERNIRAVDNATDSVGAYAVAIESRLIDAMGKAIRSAEGFATAMEKLSGGSRGAGRVVSEINEGFLRYGNTVGLTVSILEKAADAMAKYQDATEKAAASTQAQVGVTSSYRIAGEGYVHLLAAARAEILRLPTAMRQQIDAGLQMGRTMEALGEEFNLSAAAQRLYSSVTSQSAEAQKKHAAEIEKATEATQKQAQAVTDAQNRMTQGLHQIQMFSDPTIALIQHLPTPFELAAAHALALSAGIEKVRDRSGQVMDVIKLMPSVMGDFTHNANEAADAQKRMADEAKRAEAAARAHADQVAGMFGLIGVAVDAMSANANGAWRLVASGANVAVAGIQNYARALTAAEKEQAVFNVSMGIATFGISTIADLTIKAFARYEAAEERGRQIRASIAETQRQITALGATPIVQDVSFLQTGNTYTTWLKALEDQLAAVTKAAEDAAKAQEAVLAGYASASSGITASLSVTNTAYDRSYEIQKQIAALRTRMADQEGDDLAESASRLMSLNLQLADQLRIIDLTKVHSQEAADAMAGAFLGAIAGEMAGGASFVEAVRSQADGVKMLSDQMFDLGFVGSEAFTTVNGLVQMATDAVAGPALDAIAGYTRGVQGLSDAHALTAESFYGLENQIGATAIGIEGLGYTHEQVLAAMQGDLQTAWEMQEKYHYSLDDTTQALVDEAVKAGLVGEAHKSSTDQMIDALNHVARTLDFIAGLFTGQDGIAAAAEQSATSIQRSLDGIRPPTLHVPIFADNHGGFDGAEFDDPPVLDEPVRAVRKSGLAWLNPGDIAGMPSKGGMGGRQVIENNIYIDGEQMHTFVTEVGADNLSQGRWAVPKRNVRARIARQ